MTTTTAVMHRGVGLAALLLGPVALAVLLGHGEVAKYSGLGIMLALLLGLLARPVAAFAVFLPMVYAAAALTAQSTDGVVALIVAIAAAVGAAGSLGLQRGLVALLGAALLGSFEPGEVTEVARRAGWLLAGTAYGYLLVVSVLREVTIPGRAVHAPHATVGYAALLAVLALVAWYAARLGEIDHAWWLPLAVIAVSEPAVAHSPSRALLRTAIGLGATLVLVAFVLTVDVHAIRVLLLVALLSAALWQGRRHPTLLALLATPVLVLLSTLDAGAAASGAPVRLQFAAALPIFAATCLGHWAFWTLRPGSDRLPA
jgi:hypothetical protein